MLSPTPIISYRSPYIAASNTNALSVDATTLGLPAAAGTSSAQGRFLNAATAREPVAVLGGAAAQRLGIDRVGPGARIVVGGQWFYVTGILRPAVLAPEIDSSVLVGFPAAEKRRSEIGLRRALGATRGQIRAQFLAEAILLSLAGGTVGVILGAAATAAYARAHGEAIVIPSDAWAGGLAAALLIGALAGLLPAIRAARLSPTQALWSVWPAAPSSGHPSSAHCPTWPDRDTRSAWAPPPS